MEMVLVLSESGADMRAILRRVTGILLLLALTIVLMTAAERFEATRTSGEYRIPLAAEEAPVGEEGLSAAKNCPALPVSAELESGLQEPAAKEAAELFVPTGGMAIPLPGAGIIPGVDATPLPGEGNVPGEEEEPLPGEEVRPSPEDVVMSEAGSFPAVGETTAPGESAGGIISEDAAVFSAVVTVWLNGNGGEPARTQITAEAEALSPETWEIPFRPGKVFDGWYLDEACTIPFTGAEKGAAQVEVYAGWKEFAGFVCDDAGHITACTSGDGLLDGILTLPADAACTGIEAGALAEVADQVMEIFIPANITYIADGAFDGLTNLMYIEAEPGNPVCYSEGGVLYAMSGEVIAAPAWYTADAA